MQSTVGQIVSLLKARFGCENQAERYRAVLRSRKRFKGESLQKLYQAVRRLMSLAYPVSLPLYQTSSGAMPFWRR